MALFVFGASAGAVSAATTSNTAKNAAKITEFKAKADQEINRRVVVLNNVISTANNMKKISDTDKASLIAIAQKNIDDLTALKTKIDADVDLATIKTDRAGITKSYRIFMLIVPKIHILAAADRIEATTDLMNGVVTKITAKIATAQAAGKDVTTLNTVLAEMQAKIADANTQAEKAKTAVLTLVPDNGDKTAMTANGAALKTGKGFIKAGQDDLKVSRTDVETIRTGLKALGFNL